MNHKRKRRSRRRIQPSTTKASQRLKEDNSLDITTTVCCRTSVISSHRSGDTPKTMLDFYSPGSVTTTSATAVGTPPTVSTTSTTTTTTNTTIPSFEDIPLFQDIPSCEPIPTMTAPLTPPSPVATPHSTKTPPTITKTTIRTPPSPSDTFSSTDRNTPPSSTSNHNHNNNHKHNTPSTTSIPNVPKRRRTNHSNRTPPPPPSDTTHQLYLDFGQSSFATRIICPVCNCLYVHGVEEDEAVHRKVCNEYAFGVVLAWSGKTTTGTGGGGVGGSGGGAWKQLRIVSHDRTHNGDGDEEEGVVVEIRPDDPVPYRKKVWQVKRIVDREVGFVQVSQPQPKGCAIRGGGGGGGFGTPSSSSGSEKRDSVSLNGKTVFLYVLEKRIVGFCTVELVSEGFALTNVPDVDGNDDSCGDGSGSVGTVPNYRSKMCNRSVATSPTPSVPLHTNIHSKSETPPTPTPPRMDQHQNHYYRSTKPTRALMGVHQIWCHCLHRHKGIASKLVNVARSKMVYGMTVPLDKVAFSSPTMDGVAFAKRFGETEFPLVYDCR